jgi:hypothetical protein
MSTTVLNLHSGGNVVSYEELQRCVLPERTKSWVPISHATVVETARKALVEAGYFIRAEKLAISHEGKRFFGTLDLATNLCPNNSITLAVGLRNSVDQKFPMGMCAGSRVFVCSNLSFSAEVMVKRKHSINGIQHFTNDIATAVTKLADFKAMETARIDALQNCAISDDEAESYLLRAAVDKKIIPLRLLPQVLHDWRTPAHEEFQCRTAWSLFNAITSALSNLQEKNPHELSKRTMRIHTLLETKAN